VPIAEPTSWLSAFQFTKDDIMRAIEMVVMGLLGFVVLLMVVRPLVRRILAPDERRAPALPSFGGGIAPAIATASVGAAAIGNGAGEAANPGELSKTSQMIDLAQVQGQVHAQSVQKVGDIADKNPRETVSIIRQWLQESGAAA
jgi:flagellar M-ring protein FliF